MILNVLKVLKTNKNICKTFGVTSAFGSQLKVALCLIYVILRKKKGLILLYAFCFLKEMLCVTVFNFMAHLTSLFLEKLP